jgi:hypothetical protein
MLLTQLHDEPLIHVFHFLLGRDLCKLEVTCSRFRQLSHMYDNVAWKRKCRILWENKIKALVRMNEDVVLPIGCFDIHNPAVLDDLFEKTHVPLHEKVLAFQEVFNMKDSNKLIDKIKKFPKRRKLDVSTSEDKLKLDPSWKALFSLDYLTEKFHGKYRKKKGPKLYLSPMLLYSPFTVPKSAVPMPKTRVPSFQTNRFWGVGNADEIYYIIKERPASAKRSRTNSLTTSGETVLRNFFNRGRSNSVSGESKTNTDNSKLSNSTNSLPTLQNSTSQNTTHPHTTTTNPQTTKITNTTTTSFTSTTRHDHNHTTTHSTNTTTTTTTTTTSTTHANPSHSLFSSSSSLPSTTNPLADSNHSKNPLSSSTSQLEESKDAFARTMLLPLGQLYFEQRPNGSIDTVGGIWTVIQTRKGRMLVLWRIWRLVCYAEPLMPTKLAYEWLPPTPQIHPTSYLDLHYDTMGPWHSGKVVAEKLWKMRPWYDQVD